MKKGLSYIPAVDGLRAIAIVPVILFHCGLGLIRGGFVGVDVFFVISGYLITTLIVRDIEAGEFSLAAFYRRRIRRIFPALFAMLAVTLLVAYFLLLPARFDELGRSALAAALSVSNVYFWRFSGYFDTAAEQQPLLHTWSLGVEEQYYLFFPLALALLYRLFREKPKAAVITLLLLSFALNVWLTSVRPTAAFYLLPTRAWEMMLGGLLVFLTPVARGPLASSAVGLVGLAGIGAAVFTFSDMTAFPGYAALLPTAGAALVIYSIRMGGGVVSRALATTPAVFVGQMSYSLYLWHWPILFLVRYLTEPVLSPAMVALALLLTAAMSFLSWRYVERPFRNASSPVGDWEPLRWGAATIALTGLLCVLIIGTHGFAGRLKSLPFRYSDDLAYFCSDQRFPAITGEGHSCALNGLIRMADADFVVWGDSNAEMLYRPFEAAAERAGKHGAMLTYGGCAPLLGADKLGTSIPGVCLRFNEQVFKGISTNPRIKRVILAALWATNVNGHNFAQVGGLPVILRDVAGGDTSAVFRRSLARTILALRHAEKEVLIVGPTPELGPDAPQDVAKDIWLGRHRDGIAPSSAAVAAFQQPFEQIAGDFRARYGISTVNLTDMICQSSCRVVVDGNHLYRDQGHLSAAGVAFVQPKLVQTLVRWLR